jgi:hypothetical protein
MSYELIFSNDAYFNGERHGKSYKETKGRLNCELK